MSIKNKFLEVKIGSHNTQYYENLGYDVHKRPGKNGVLNVPKNTKILIDIKDIYPYSNEYIVSVCDGCGREKEVRYIDYINILRENGKTFCKVCGNTGKFYSIGQWMIDNGYDVNKYWGKQNIISPFEVSYGCRTNYYFICQKINYHGEYPCTPNNFTSGNNGRCSYCHGKSTHILDSLGTLFPDSIKLWSSKNITSPYEYTPKSNRDHIFWKCPDGKHEDFERKIASSTMYEFRCPQCSWERKESFLQEKVRLYIESFGYNVLHEGNCTLKPMNPKTNKQLFYDNEIKELKLVIEVMGDQHIGTHYYKNICKISEEEALIKLKDLQERDLFKKEYAISNGYFYLDIPYGMNNKNKDWKILIDNKLKEILEQKDG